jgi:glycosyltransferase involved in cell wall biosynthesis
VVIPLKENIGSSGQMVSIASMSLGKTTVFPDFPSVSQYFEDGTTGLMYRGGDEDSLVSILKLVKSDSKRCSEIGREAYTSWDRKFNGDRFAGAVIDHIKDFFWSAR